MNHHFFKTIMVGAFAAAMILGGAGCKKAPSGAKVTVTAFSLSATSLELKIDETNQLDVLFFPENANKLPTLVWESDNDKVATVSQEGLVTAVGVGTAVVTARTNDGSLSETCAVKVWKDKGFEFSEEKYYVWGGAEYPTQLTFTTTPSTLVAEDFNWKLDRPELLDLQLDKEAYARALADGTCTLTVTLKDGDGSLVKTASVRAYKRRFGVFPKTDAQVSLSGDGIEDGATIDMSKVKTHFGQPAIFIGANGFGGGALVEEFEIIVEDKGIVKVAEINKFLFSTMALCIQLPLGTGSGTAKMTIKNTMKTGDGSVVNTYTREFTLLVPESTTTE